MNVSLVSFLLLLFLLFLFLHVYLFVYILWVCSCLFSSHHFKLLSQVFLKSLETLSFFRSRYLENIIFVD